MTTLTTDMLSTLSDAELRSLEKVGAFKAVVLDFKVGRAQADIDFSNQSVYVLAGREYELWEVIHFAFSNLSLTKDNDYNNQAVYTKLAAVKTEAWNILKRIQRGKEAQGEKFSLATEDMRKFVDAVL